MSRIQILTDRIFPVNVFGRRSFSLTEAQVGNVERRNVHVVCAELVGQSPVPLRAGQGHVVQFQLVPLISAMNQE